MGSDMTDSGLVAERGRDSQPGKWLVAFEEEPVGAKSDGPMVGDSVVEHFFELGVQRDVAVVVHFADRDA